MTAHQLSRPTGATAVAVAMVVATACGGPPQQLHFGGKAVPINVAFGGPALGDPRLSTGPTIDVAAPAGLGVVPVPTSSPARQGATATTAPRAGAPASTQPLPGAARPQPTPCADRDPLVFPRTEADNQVRTDAPRGTFVYRLTGATSGPTGTGPFRAEVAHQIAPIGIAADGTRTFSDTFTSDRVKSVATYKARASDGVAVAGQGVDNGEVELVSLTSTPEGGTTSSLAPSGSGLRFLQLRASDGVAWRDSAVDAASSSTATIDAKIVSRAVINACGQPVAAWQVAATQTTVTPSENITATVTRWIATQYGGIVVQEEVSYRGTKNGVAVEGRYLSTISRDPGA